MSSCFYPATILLPHHPKCWDFRHAKLCPPISLFLKHMLLIPSRNVQNMLIHSVILENGDMKTSECVCTFFFS
jgi:hypothetical protein